MEGRRGHLSWEESLKKGERTRNAEIHKPRIIRESATQACLFKGIIGITLLHRMPFRQEPIHPKGPGVVRTGVGEGHGGTRNGVSKWWGI